MGIYYENLDERVREFMLKELELDLSQNDLYIGKRLNEVGRDLWPMLLREAISQYDDDWLAYELRERGCLNWQEPRTSQRGRTTWADVPYDANVTLAEGQFNQFYARGLCAIAMEDGVEEVEVYRGKEVRQPRSSSRRLIGRRLPARQLIADLRKSKGIDPALGIPPGPNSGLTVKLPEED